MVDLMSTYIKNLFSEIHNNYDLMNSILSLGIDRKWRKAAAKLAMPNKQSFKLLDIACGTGEFAIALYKESLEKKKSASIIGIDFNSNMLKVGVEKIKMCNLPIKLIHGDALNIKFDSNTFDVVTSAFAMRDFDDIDRFAYEVNRVLKKGGKITLMDMAAPNSGFDKYIFKIYSKIMRIEGYFVDNDAYRFLVKSIMENNSTKVADIFKKNGFANVKITTLKTGAAFVITGDKK